VSTPTFPLRRAAAQDERLSFRARGIIAEHVSRPPGWRSDAVSLSRRAKEGEKAVRAALRELEQLGYLQRERVRTPQGRIVTEWTLSDSPSRGFTDRRFPPVGEPPVGSPPPTTPPVRQPPGRRSPVLEGRETDRETPPPTPAVTDLSEVRATALARVVVEEIDGKAPKPSSGVLTAACRRLLAEGWTNDELRAAVRAHAWTGAGAGAVVAFVRALGPEDRSSAAQKPARKRPDWCGACDEASRLVTDAQSGRPRRCPDCHPLATKARRTP